MNSRTPTRVLSALAVCVALVACAEKAAPPLSAPAMAARSNLRDLFPHIRADLEARIIEVDGIVPLDCHNPKTPRVYLEQFVCAPDSKEHESLVMTRALPSHLHAALLAIGLTPGSPGSFERDPAAPGGVRALAATGDRLRISVVREPERTGDCTGFNVPMPEPLTDWVVHAENGEPFAAHRETKIGERLGGEPGFVFSGSRMVVHQGREVYDADGAGTIVGLTSFGSEVISWSRTISPDSALDEPVWIADVARVPKMGTPVTLRIEPAR